MALSIDKKLNLVIPLDYGKTTIYVHAAPISRETFETHFMVMSKAFATIHREHLNVAVGPRVAALVLKQEAEELGIWDGGTGVQNTLIAEMNRLTNVIIPRDTGGWETVPFQEAIDHKRIDEDDLAEVNNALVFFTLASSIYPRRDQVVMLAVALSLWGGLLVPLDSTAYAASLKTSTETGSTGEKPKPAGSSHPS